MNARRWWPFRKRQDERLNAALTWQREQRAIQEARSRLLDTAATTREWTYRRDDEAQP